MFPHLWAAYDPIVSHASSCDTFQYRSTVVNNDAKQKRAEVPSRVEMLLRVSDIFRQLGEDLTGIMVFYEYRKLFVRSLTGNHFGV